MSLKDRLLRVFDLYVPNFNESCLSMLSFNKMILGESTSLFDLKINIYKDINYLKRHKNAFFLIFQIPTTSFKTSSI